MTYKIKTTILATLCLGLMQPASAREEAPIIYSNMNMEQISTLFKDVGFVGHAEWFTEGHKQYHKVIFRWFSNNGNARTCAFNTDYNIHKYYKAKVWSDTLKSNKFKTKYPVLKGRLSNGFVGYFAPQYSPENGELNTYSEYVSERKWKAGWSGHLQKRIPAVVYKLCPKFPSAKSLGAEINHKQTSDNYFELLMQDPGARIKRPDLVTEDPVIRY